jgi:nickel-dependent lactate racemase
VKVDFPHYEGVPALEVPDDNLVGVFALSQRPPAERSVSDALDHPLGTPRLRDLAARKNSVLVIVDDVSRPTPAWKIVPFVLEELAAAGVADSAIEFIMALGTHRPMTEDEMRAKLGAEVHARYPCHNHAWDDPGQLVHVGNTPQGVEVWVNRKVAEAELVIGIGRIMPIDIAGFTGGGKIIVPGLCGEVTVNEMHWTRVDLDDAEVLGRRDNEVRASIDELARAAGLDFILNVVMDASGNVFDCVAGDLEVAHREGCRRAREYHEVKLPREADIVIVDGYPFDIEFWQVNKALDAAGTALREGGVVICVSPCFEGLSRTHEADLLEFGYRPVAEIKELVRCGRIHHKVVGVHMIQVAKVAVEKATVFLVGSCIPHEKIERVGMRHAPTPQEAFDEALGIVGEGAAVTVLRGAAEMLVTVDS